MNRNSHNLRGLSTHAPNPVPRWRTVFIALVLVLAIGSAAQTPPVQAAPAGELVYFSMKVVNPKTTLRCGQTATYLVRVELAQSKGAPTPAPGSFGLPKGQSVVNVKVEASSVNKTAGDFVGTAAATTSVVFDDDLTGLAAKFKFKAGKPGKTKLYFEGLVGKEYVSTELNVKVLPCKFKAKTVLQFSTAYYNLTGISSDAVMIADEHGNYTGSASMSWAYSNVISGGGPCRYSMLAADSQVDLVGQLDEDGGQVMTTATFQPTTVSSTVSCTIVTGTGPDPATVYPLTFTVDSSGGVSTQTATAEGIQGGLELEGPVYGTARVILIPEADEAVAFIPGNYQPRVSTSSPLWWAMLWDNFPSLFSALLPLR